MHPAITTSRLHPALLPDAAICYSDHISFVAMPQFIPFIQMASALSSEE
jgi:hypothetical protein